MAEVDLARPPARIVLASASPRRLALLEQIGVVAEAAPVHLDERQRIGETAAAMVIRLARAKADAGWQAQRDGQCLVIGADTTIVLDDEVIGKPADRAAAIDGLLRLGGRSHEVLTAVAMCQGGPAGRHETSCISRSRVTFRDITVQQAEAYWRSGEPHGKAGGYAIQGLGAVFVTAIDGSYSGIMGLPLFETATLLAGFGVNILED